MVRTTLGEDANKIIRMYGETETVAPKAGSDPQPTRATKSTAHLASAQTLSVVRELVTRDLPVE